MGTTCTVAYVARDEVVVAHVGDSRCYLLRDGDLTRITRDHSLVGELVDRGKVTEEEALTHPQRSVITRAVGPEPSVKVDADRIAARAGDVFLLCSDGLTDMVRDRDIARILQAVPSLEQAGRNLIAAANAAGGRDNITVILFKLEEVDGPAAASNDTGAVSIVDEDTREYNTFQGEAVAQPRQGVSRPQGSTRRSDELRSSGGATRASDEAEAEYRASGTVALSAVRPRAQPIEEGHAHAPPTEKR
jgi:protein phosphatase